VRPAGLLHPAADPGVRRVSGSFGIPSPSEAEACSGSGKGSFRDASPFEVSPRSQPSAVSPRFSRTPALLPFTFRKRLGSRVFLRDRVHGLPRVFRPPGPYNFLGFLLSSWGRLSGLLRSPPEGGDWSRPLHGEGAPVRAGVGRYGSGARVFFQAGFASRRPVSRVRLHRGDLPELSGASRLRFSRGFPCPFSSRYRPGRLGMSKELAGGGSCLGRLHLPEGRWRRTVWTGTRLGGGGAGRSARKIGLREVTRTSRRTSFGQGGCPKGGSNRPWGRGRSLSPARARADTRSVATRGRYRLDLVMPLVLARGSWAGGRPGGYEIGLEASPASPGSTR
jgi:hypothetical protein